MRVENLSLDGSRDENCAEKLGKEIGLTGCNEIAQGGGVGDNRHRQLLELSSSVREFFKCSRFAVKLGWVVVI